MNGALPAFAIGYYREAFSEHSGLWQAIRLLDAELIFYRRAWAGLERASWRLGDVVRRWGIRYYGSAWNALAPWRDEARFLRRLPKSGTPYVVHFFEGEFGAPHRAEPYRRRGARLVVNCHCSARRWDSVWLRPDGYAQADQVILMSRSQRPCAERHVPPERIRVIPHGVDVGFFRPPDQRNDGRRRLRLFLMGDTERDHAFAVRVAAKLPADRFEWRVRTGSHERAAYQGIGCVSLVPRLSDEEMREEYRQTDVLAMPMLDSAANNVILESMACGTPVMVNRVGGVPEYVDPSCNFLTSDDRNVDEWVEKLLWLEARRDEAERMRPAVRAWAERFDWKIVAGEYRAAYRDVLARG